MRVLYLTDGFPYPLTSGRLRHYFLIRELSRHHRITLLAVVGTAPAPEDVAALSEYTEEVAVFAPVGAGSLLGRKLRAGVRALLSKAPADETLGEMHERIVELTANGAFDALIVGGKQPFFALPRQMALPMVADLCDAASHRTRLQIRYSSPAQRVPLLFEYMQLVLIEQRLIGAAAHLVFASPRDRAIVVGRDNRVRASVVPNGVDLGYWRRTSSDVGTNTIIFTGVLDYAPNTDAAIHLAHDIFPRVRRSVPEAQLLLVGRDPPRSVTSTATARGVTVTGYVDDVRPYLERATVFAAPLRFAAGIQNKLLEAMAMELPVVAYPIAAAGLEPEGGPAPPIDRASDARSFAELLVERLERASESRTPDAYGRAFVADHFRWELSAAKLHGILEELPRAGLQDRTSAA